MLFFITGGGHLPREQVEREVLPAFIAGGYWAAVEKVGGRFIGWFHLRPPDDPELGYRLRRDLWGRGYATEAAER